MPAAKNGLPPSLETTLRFGSRAEHVARYLREAIARGQFAPPLPATRLWSQRLGVSRSTLDAALKQLVEERLVEVAPRGIRLRSGVKALQASGVRPRLRWLLPHNPHYNASHYQTVAGMLQERMRLKGIDVTWETATPCRLQEIARSPARAGELCILASVSPAVQQAFADAGRPALVLGEVAPGLSLPFVNADFSGAIRHATFQLLRAGCRRLVLLHLRMEAAGLKRASEAFLQAAAEWPAQQAPARVVASAPERASVQAAVRRLVANIAPDTGFIVAAPAPVTMLAGALTQAGWQIPQQVRLAGIFHVAEAVGVYQPLLYYPWPMAAILARITAAAETFLASGSLPAAGRTAPAILQRLA